MLLLERLDLLARRQDAIVDFESLLLEQLFRPHAIRADMVGQHHAIQCCAARLGHADSSLVGAWHSAPGLPRFPRRRNQAEPFSTSARNSAPSRSPSASTLCPRPFERCVRTAMPSGFSARSATWSAAAGTTWSAEPWMS